MKTRTFNTPSNGAGAMLTTEAVTRAIRTGTGTGAEHLTPVLSVMTLRRTVRASR